MASSPYTAGWVGPQGQQAGEEGVSEPVAQPPGWPLETWTQGQSQEGAGQAGQGEGQVLQQQHGGSLQDGARRVRAQSAGTHRDSRGSLGALEGLEIEEEEVVFPLEGEEGEEGEEGGLEEEEENQDELRAWELARLVSRGHVAPRGPPGQLTAAPGASLRARAQDEPGTSQSQSFSPSLGPARRGAAAAGPREAEARVPRHRPSPRDAPAVPDSPALPRRRSRSTVSRGEMGPSIQHRARTTPSRQASGRAPATGPGSSRPLTAPSAPPPQPEGKFRGFLARLGLLRAPPAPGPAPASRPAGGRAAAERESRAATGVSGRAHPGQRDAIPASGADPSHLPRLFSSRRSARVPSVRHSAPTLGPTSISSPSLPSSVWGGPEAEGWDSSPLMRSRNGSGTPGGSSRRLRETILSLRTPPRDDARAGPRPGSARMAGSRGHTPRRSPRHASDRSRDPTRSVRVPASTAHRRSLSAIQLPSGDLQRVYVGRVDEPELCIHVRPVDYVEELAAIQEELEALKAQHALWKHQQQQSRGYTEPSQDGQGGHTSGPGSPLFASPLAAFTPRLGPEGGAPAAPGPASGAPLPAGSSFRSTTRQRSVSGPLPLAADHASAAAAQSGEGQGVGMGESLRLSQGPQAASGIGIGEVGRSRSSGGGPGAAGAGSSLGTCGAEAPLVSCPPSAVQLLYGLALVFKGLEKPKLMWQAVQRAQDAAEGSPWAVDRLNWAALASHDRMHYSFALAAYEEEGDEEEEEDEEADKEEEGGAGITRTESTGARGGKEGELERVEKVGTRFAHERSRPRDRGSAEGREAAASRGAAQLSDGPLGPSQRRGRAVSALDGAPRAAPGLSRTASAGRESRRGSVPSGGREVGTRAGARDGERQGRVAGPGSSRASSRTSGGGILAGLGQWLLGRGSAARAETGETGRRSRRRGDPATGGEAPERVGATRRRASARGSASGEGTRTLGEGGAEASTREGGAEASTSAREGEEQGRYLGPLLSAVARGTSPLQGPSGVGSSGGAGGVPGAASMRPDASGEPPAHSQRTDESPRRSAACPAHRGASQPPRTQSPWSGPARERSPLPWSPLSRSMSPMLGSLQGYASPPSAHPGPHGPGVPPGVPSRRRRGIQWQSEGAMPLAGDTLGSPQGRTDSPATDSPGPLLQGHRVEPWGLSRGGGVSMGSIPLLSLDESACLGDEPSPGSGAAPEDRRLTPNHRMRSRGPHSEGCIPLLGHSEEGEAGVYGWGGSPWRMSPLGSCLVGQGDEKEEPEGQGGSDVVTLVVGREQVVCRRSQVAALSLPLTAMLRGPYRESGQRTVRLDHNGISSPAALRAVAHFAHTGTLQDLSARAPDSACTLRTPAGLSSAQGAGTPPALRPQAPEIHPAEAPPVSPLLLGHSAGTPQGSPAWLGGHSPGPGGGPLGWDTGGDILELTGRGERWDQARAAPLQGQLAQGGAGSRAAQCCCSLGDLVEVLRFAQRFCCTGLKAECERWLCASIATAFAPPAHPWHATEGRVSRPLSSSRPQPLRSGPKLTPSMSMGAMEGPHSQPPPAAAATQAAAEDSSSSRPTRLLDGSLSPPLPAARHASSPHHALLSRTVSASGHRGASATAIALASAVAASASPGVGPIWESPVGNTRTWSARGAPGEHAAAAREEEAEPSWARTSVGLGGGSQTEVRPASEGLPSTGQPAPNFAGSPLVHPRGGPGVAPLHSTTSDLTYAERTQGARASMGSAGAGRAHEGGLPRREGMQQRKRKMGVLARMLRIALEEDAREVALLCLEAALCDSFCLLRSPAMRALLLSAPWQERLDTAGLLSFPWLHLLASAALDWQRDAEEAAAVEREQQLLLELQKQRLGLVGAAGPCAAAPASAAALHDGLPLQPPLAAPSARGGSCGTGLDIPPAGSGDGLRGVASGNSGSLCPGGWGTGLQAYQGSADNGVEEAGRGSPLPPGPNEGREGQAGEFLGTPEGSQHKGQTSAASASHWASLRLLLLELAARAAGRRTGGGSQRQKAAAYHELGCCLMAQAGGQEQGKREASLARAEAWLRRAVQEGGHAYSRVPLARLMLRRGRLEEAQEELAPLFATAHSAQGWMFQERAFLALQAACRASAGHTSVSSAAGAADLGERLGGPRTAGALLAPRHATATAATGTAKAEATAAMAPAAQGPGEGDGPLLRHASGAGEEEGGAGLGARGGNRARSKSARERGSVSGPVALEGRGEIAVVGEKGAQGEEDSQSSRALSPLPLRRAPHPCPHPSPHLRRSCSVSSSAIPLSSPSSITQTSDSNTNTSTSTSSNTSGSSTGSTSSGNTSSTANSSGGTPSGLGAKGAGYETSGGGGSMESILRDLDLAQELDPRLVYPYRLRASLLMDAQRPKEALAEVSAALRFLCSPLLLELRVYFRIVTKDVAGAIRDLHALAALAPAHGLYFGHVGPLRLLRLLQARAGARAPRPTAGGFWLDLHQCWSAADDLGSLAAVSGMLHWEADHQQQRRLQQQAELLLQRHLGALQPEESSLPPTASERTSTDPRARHQRQQQPLQLSGSRRQGRVRQAMGSARTAGRRTAAHGEKLSGSGSEMGEGSTRRTSQGSSAPGGPGAPQGLTSGGGGAGGASLVEKGSRGCSLLFFRQSLLLLRLNQPRRAMQQLLQARQHAWSRTERLVLHGWLLYDMGRRAEALRKARASLRLQPSFEGFFLAAFVLADKGTAAAAAAVAAVAASSPADGVPPAGAEARAAAPATGEGQARAGTGVAGADGAPAAAADAPQPGGADGAPPADAEAAGPGRGAPLAGALGLPMAHLASAAAAAATAPGRGPHLARSASMTGFQTDPPPAGGSAGGGQGRGTNSAQHQTSLQVMQLLQGALASPSDALRKGQALSNLGSVFVFLGEHDKALWCYQAALEIRHTRAHQGIARVLALQGKRPQAREEMSQMIALCPGLAVAHEKRAEYSDDKGDVLQDLAAVTRLDPLRTYPYRYRAAALMDEGRHADAISELSRAIQFSPEFQLLHLRAMFREHLGQHAAALRDCRAALCLDPGHADSLGLQARILHSLGLAPAPLAAAPPPPLPPPPAPGISVAPAGLNAD